MEITIILEIPGWTAITELLSREFYRQTTTFGPTPWLLVTSFLPSASSCLTISVTPILTRREY